MKLTPVTLSRHAGKGWRSPSSLTFASSQSAVPIVGMEFARVAVSMPIAFVEQAQSFLPMAVMSPIAGRNLFIDRQGRWLGSYVPTGLSTYPFGLGRVEGSDEGTLCIDEDSGLIVEADDNAPAFFDSKGKPSAAAQSVVSFLVKREHSRSLTETAVAALAEAGVIEPWPLQVTLGSQTMLVKGLFRISEARLNELDDGAFLTLRRAGALPLAYVQLLSMGQTTVFGRLNLRHQEVVQAPQHQPPISSLDEIFEQAGSMTLKFD